jgi:hypothetical protein
MHENADAAVQHGHVNPGFNYDKVCHHVRVDETHPAPR